MLATEGHVIQSCTAIRNRLIHGSFYVTLLSWHILESVSLGACCPDSDDCLTSVPEECCFEREMCNNRCTQGTRSCMKKLRSKVMDVRLPCLALTPCFLSSSFKGAKLHFFPNMQLYHLQKEESILTSWRPGHELPSRYQTGRSELWGATQRPSKQDRQEKRATVEEKLFWRFPWVEAWSIISAVQ